MFGTDSRYEQIIGLSHHVSDKHEKMSMQDRAAQFSPFAALTGYDDSISEAGRLTDMKEFGDDDRFDELDRHIAILSENVCYKPSVTVRYFIADVFKEGGKYVEKTGIVRRIDTVSKILAFTDGQIISISDIISLKSDLFEEQI